MPDRFNKPVGHMTKRPEDQGSQDPDLPARTNETAEGVEAEVEPAEEQEPPVADPDQVRHVPVAVTALPDCRREDQVEFPEFGRNLVLVLQQPLGILLAVVGIQLDASTAHHLLAPDGALALFQERNLADGGEEAARSVLQQRPAILAHIALEVAGGHFLEPEIELVEPRSVRFALSNQLSERSLEFSERDIV